MPANEDHIRIFETENPTVIFSTPPVLTRLIRSGLMTEKNLIRLWYVSGSPINTNDAIAMEGKLKKGIVMQACSRAESNVPFMSNLDDPLEKRIFTVGYPPKKKITRIVDGELQIKKNYIIPMLFNEHEFTKDEWYSTGDLIEVDSDGYYIFKGRKKLLINYGPKDVNPLEVEDIVDSLEDIEKSYCVGIELKEDPHTKYLCLAIDGKNIKKDELKVFLQKTLNLAFYDIFLMKDFPMTDSGKINRIELTKRIQNIIDNNY